MKASVWVSIAKLVDLEMERITSESTTEDIVSATPTFTAGLVELVFRQLITVGEDLEMFGKHAKRKVIIPEDMYMVCRKNPALKNILTEYIENWEEQKKNVNTAADGEYHQRQQHPSSKDIKTNESKNASVSRKDKQTYYDLDELNSPVWDN
ncbi:unnamed protein product [Ambrosiozyma monospora]|uniref:Unnamed protein product n=1 Tax=Ambrosiozyma monospora TaxID=43982 RepID=A0ACB5U6W3_AMBMO|nr:unnamed protein product [Ambrosiozyma monospora]